MTHKLQPGSTVGNYRVAPDGSLVALRTAGTGRMRLSTSDCEALLEACFTFGDDNPRPVAKLRPLGRTVLGEAAIAAGREYVRETHRARTYRPRFTLDGAPLGTSRGLRGSHKARYDRFLALHKEAAIRSASLPTPEPMTRGGNPAVETTTDAHGTPHTLAWCTACQYGVLHAIHERGHMPSRYAVYRSGGARWLFDRITGEEVDPSTFVGGETDPLLAAMRPGGGYRRPGRG